MKTNVHAFKRLIKLYESISYKKIEDKFKTTPFTEENRGFCKTKGGYIANNLTGFGQSHRCLLCKESDKLYNDYHMCFTCLHSMIRCKEGYPDYESLKLSCLRNSFDDSYYDISKSKTPKELYLAFRRRAKDLRKILDELGYKQPK
jgi:hypothetical protein